MKSVAYGTECSCTHCYGACDCWKHISSILYHCHWLTVCFRVQFKVLVMKGLEQGYLKDHFYP